MERLLTDDELPTKGITKYVRLALAKGESVDLIRRVVEDEIECFVEHKKTPRSFDQHLIEILGEWGATSITITGNQSELWRIWMAEYAKQSATEKAKHDLIARCIEALSNSPQHDCIRSPTEL